MKILSYIFHTPKKGTSFEEDCITDKHIDSLANDVLSTTEFNKTLELIKNFEAGDMGRKSTIAYLQNIIGNRPKRPVYYVTEQYLPHLPHYTRDIMRYLGDYVDILVKYMASEILLDKKNLKKSLGINANYLKGKIDDALIKSLINFNEVIYVPAKHDFAVKHKSHRFNYREVIITCVIVVKLANEVKRLSPLAKKYAEDKIPLKY
jgi:hypothetical protein